MTDPDVKALARRLDAIEKGLAALGRSRQLTASSIPVVVDGEEGPETVEMPLTTGVSQGVRAGAAAEEALAEARQAIEDAANALVTSNGKNSRRRGQTEPEPPEGGWVQGDQWVVDNAEGVPVEVRVWNGTEFVPEQVLAAELLVLSSGGVVRLADGVVTADAIAADAIDGMVITGARVRTAATGQRLELDVNGLTAYNSAGAVGARITSADAGVQVLGSGTQDGLASLLSPQRLDTRRDVAVGGIFTEREGSEMYRGWLRTRYVKYGSPSVEDRSSLAEMVTSDYDSDVREARARVQSVKAGQGAGTITLYARPDTVELSMTQGGQSIYLGRSVVSSVEVWRLQATGRPLRIEAPSITFSGPVSFQGDSDWVSFYDLIGMSSPWAKRADGPFIRVRDGRAYMRGGVNNTTGYPSGWQAWPSLLPAMYRPKADVEFDVASPLASQTKAFRFNADGSINYYASASGNAPWLFDQCWWWLS